VIWTRADRKTLLQRAIFVLSWVVLLGAPVFAGWWIVPYESYLSVGLPFLVFVVALLLVGPFGLLIGFIAVLFTRPGDFFPALEHVGIAKTFGLVALVMILSGKLLKRDLSWARSHFNPWMVALSVAVFISVIDSVDRGTSFTFFNNVYIKIVVLWALMMETITTRNRTVMFQAVIGVMTAVIAAYSIWARFNAVNLVEGSRSSFVGLFADPNDLAMALLMSVPFLAEAAFSPKMKVSRPIWMLLLFLNLAGLIVTQSRGGLLGLGVVAFVFLQYRLKNIVLVGGLCFVGLLGLVTVAGIGERQTVAAHGGGLDASARGRLDAWVAGGRMLIYNPLTGVGLFQVHEMFGAYAVNPVEWRNKTSHNAFVQCGAETGLLGLTPFLALVLMAFWSTFRLIREVPPDATPIQRAFLQSQLGTVGAVMMASLFLSVAWSWFFYIVIAQAATSHRVWLTMPAVLNAAADASPAPA
jgi:putative inorganic carbon (HCO3(-)) transporter